MRPALARNSSEPLYKQLATHLLDRITSGALAVGERLPGEHELAQQYAVSRITVRQAIALLVKGGKLTAQRGKGTFVTGRVVRHQLDALQGFYDSLRQQGIEPETTLLDWSTVAGLTDGVLPEGVQLPVRLQRLYAVDGQPFAFVTGYLPQAAAAVGRKRAERLTVYDILEQYLGRLVQHAEVTIRCCRPSREVAAALRIPRTGMVLLMERRSFDANGEACEAMRIHIVPERYEFRLRVSGPLELARGLHPVSNQQLSSARSKR